MKNLIYLCYGGGPYVQETIFSVYSAIRLLPPRRDEYRFVVYTDTPEKLASLPVLIERIDRDRIKEWAGPFDYFARPKICSMIDAVGKYRGRCALIDSDTYFEESPDKLFDRIGPGHSVMHVREGPLYSWGADQLANLLASEQLYTTRDEPWNLSPYTTTWNSGIIGLDYADAAVLEEVLHLNDIIYPKTRQHITEQFACTVALGRYTRRTESFDIVHHYWHPTTRAAFRETLPRILGETEGLPEVEKARRLWKYRPLEPLSWRLPFRIKLAAKRLGLFPKGRRRPMALAATS